MLEIFCVKIQEEPWQGNQVVYHWLQQYQQYPECRDRQALHVSQPRELQYRTPLQRGFQGICLTASYNPSKTKVIMNMWTSYCSIFAFENRSIYRNIQLDTFSYWSPDYYDGNFSDRIYFKQLIHIDWNKTIWTETLWQNKETINQGNRVKI